MATRKRLGDILQERGLLDEQQLQAALEMQQSSGEKLGEALVKLGYLSDEQIADALSDHLNIPRINLSEQYISSNIINKVPDHILRRNEVCPVAIEDNKLVVAMVDPLNIMTIDELQKAVGLQIQPLIATSSEITSALQGKVDDMASSANQVFARYVDEQPEEEGNDRQEHLGDAPGVQLVSLIFQQAFREDASDIHLEPLENNMRVRFRVDGVLRDVMTIPKNLRAEVNSRVKVIADLDITERRKPQDGRIQTTIDDQDIEMRISTLPTVYGEKIVVRLLNKGILQIEEFGFSKDSEQKVKRMLRQSQGLILATGPTGSGKTTTLYGFLNQLNHPERNIITVEDPVEYRLDGINQVQVNSRVDLTFATGLRTVLRQDPDVIMVGEIRDQKTAEIAVRSALTGHLVLSTLHTNNAIASVVRLLDMKIESYLISSTVIGIIAQRLVRKICQKCKEPQELTDPIMINFIKSAGLSLPKVVYQGKGCPVCKGTGYNGRIAIEEVLVLNNELRQGIDKHLTESELKQMAVNSGMISLHENALAKLYAGVTTVSEIIRAVYTVGDAEITEEEVLDADIE